MRLSGTGCAVSALVAAFLLAGCGTPAVTLQAGPTGPRTVLQANDATDGSLRWQVELGPTEDATEPVLAGDTVIVALPIGDAKAYSLTDGSLRWTLPGAPLPAVVTGGLAVFDLGDRIEARHTGTGTVAWSRRTAGDLVRAHAGGPVALVYDAAKKGAARSSAAKPARPARSRVSLLDPATGSDIWSVTLPGRADLGSSAVSARHILVTYAEDYSGRNAVVALRRSDGMAEWSYPASGVNAVNAVTAEGEIPAVTVGLDKAWAEALDPKTGKKLWSVSRDEMFDPHLAPFVGQAGTTAFRRDPLTGKRLPGSVPATYGVGAHGDLLVGADGRTLTALRGATTAWTADVPPGANPVTYLDLDDRVVVSVTAVGQKRARG